MLPNELGMARAVSKMAILSGTGVDNHQFQIYKIVCNETVLNI